MTDKEYQYVMNEWKIFLKMLLELGKPKNTRKWKV